MSSILEANIAKLNVIYNNSMSQLSKYYISNYNAIIRSKMNASRKQNYINSLNLYYKNQTTILLNTLNLNIQKLRLEAIVTATATPIGPANKKALLIGCNYVATQYQLNGCINDAINIKNKLSSTYGFTNIKLMTDDTVQKPTRINIINEITNLLANSVSGDILFILFSGHGTSFKDTNNDELDGMDEYFVPLDFNCISDDEMKVIIQNNLKKDVKLLALFDSCHSGTVLDLKYQYLDSNNSNKTTVNDACVETIGDVYLISGCMDNQTSADAFINNISQGAMTWGFLDALNKSSNLTWNSLITNMCTSLKNSKYTQIPQLSSGKLLDINGAFSMLN